MGEHSTEKDFVRVGAQTLRVVCSHHEDFITGQFDLFGALLPTATRRFLRPNARFGAIFAANRLRIAPISSVRTTNLHQNPLYCQAPNAGRVPKWGLTRMLVVLSIALVLTFTRE